MAPSDKNKQWPVDALYIDQGRPNQQIVPDNKADVLYVNISFVVFRSFLFTCRVF